MESNDLFEHLAEIQFSSENRTDIEQELFDKFGKNLAVVCMDSTGFSRTVKDRGIIYYLTILAKMRKIVTAQVKKRNAISYRAYADNYFAEFSSVADAFAAVVKSCLAIRNAGLLLNEHEPYQLCIGIGFGRVLFSETEGPFGDQMNLASKLGEDTAEGDEILLTPEAFHELPEEIQRCCEKRHFTISKVEADYYRTTIDLVSDFVD